MSMPRPWLIRAAQLAAAFLIAILSLGALQPGTVRAALADVRINEVESNGGTPGDWVELINNGAAPVDVGGLRFIDNDDTHTFYTIPGGTSIAPGGYLVLEEAQFGFGLGAAESARLFEATGTALVDSYSWTAHAATTYGRCPNGAGGFATTATSTKGAANDCPSPYGTIKINEVESNGGTPGDWVELVNTGSAAVDVSGLKFRDSDGTHAFYAIPAGTSIPAGGYLLLEEAQFGFGLGAGDSALLVEADELSAVDSYSWTAHASTTYGRCPNGSGAFTTTASSTKGAANDCGIVAPSVRINEVESNGGTPGDWVELINTGAVPTDVSGLKFRDNDATHVLYEIPAGTSIAAGGYLVLEEAQFGFGLGAPDSTTIYLADGVTVVDTYTWTDHATTTYGRCPNSSGSFATTSVSTKGASNSCPGEITAVPWPGDPDVAVVDPAGVLGGNMSGLAYETGTPSVLWAARNGPGTLHRLVRSGDTWAPDTTLGWSAGKLLRYPDGTGDPDAEGVTFTVAGSAGGLYVATERNNAANTVSRLSVLLFDVSGSDTTLTAVREWNLTADLPAVGPNLGLEAITWVPDSYLVGRGFFDEAKSKVYSPADYPNHGSGLFLVGVEATGGIHAYALNSDGTFARVASIVSGFTGVMDLSFESSRSRLWAVCDDTCSGRSATLEVNASGRFTVTQVFERPATMPNLNNEGFTTTPPSECVANRKPVFWSDDSATGGNAIRRGTLDCGDAQAPVVTVPVGISLEATGPTTTVTYSGVSATDGAVPVPFTCVPASGSAFAVGTKTVTCSATDTAGNTGSASFPVTVADSTRPTITVNDVVTDATTPTTTPVTFSSAATDLVDGPVSATCAPASGSGFAIGSTTVNCSASDAAGNKATATFTVKVRSVDEQLAALMAVVQDLSARRGIEGSLQVQLRLAQRLRFPASCLPLRTFTGEVNVLPARLLPRADAEALVASATRIRGAMGCP